MGSVTGPAGIGIEQSCALDPSFDAGGFAMTSVGAAMAVLTDAQDGVTACGRLPVAFRLRHPWFRPD